MIGLHAHAGSGITLSDNWAQTALFLHKFTEHFPHVQILNLGGGLPVPTLSQPAGAAGIDLTELHQSLLKVKQVMPQMELWLEPGRFMVAESGVLLARVTQRKVKGSTHFVGLDTGMNSLIRPALYGAYHHIVNLSRLKSRRNSANRLLASSMSSESILKIMLD